MADIDYGAAHVHFVDGSSVPFDIVIHRYDTNWMAGIRVSDDSGTLRKDGKTEYDAFLKGHYSFCTINSENVNWVAGPREREIENGTAYYHKGMANRYDDDFDISFPQLVEECVGKLEVNSRSPHLSEAEKQRNRREAQRERQRQSRSFLERIFGT